MAKKKRQGPPRGRSVIYRYVRPGEVGLCRVYMRDNDSTRYEHQQRIKRALSDVSRGKIRYAGAYFIPYSGRDE